MRKNINKLVAVAIGLSVMSGSIMPVFAADATITQNTSAITNVQAQKNVKSVLTLDDAITAAVNNSDKLALKSKEITMYEDKLELQDEIDGSGFPYDSLELSVKQTKEQKDFMEDQIAQDITDKYNDLVAKTREVNNLKEQIEIRNKEIKDSELKKKLGLITSIDMKNAQIELQTLQNKEKDKENKLKNSQDYFKVLTDKDLNNYTLKQDAKYEVFKIDGSVDVYLDEVIDKYLKYDNKILKLNKDNIKDHKVEKPTASKPDSDSYLKNQTNADGSITQVKDDAAYQAAEKQYESNITTYGAYLENKYKVSSGEVTLDETKKSLKNGLKDSYATLLNLENSINVMRSSLEVANKQLSIAKLKYDTGLITKTEYNKQVVGSEDLDTNLRTLIDNYNKLKNSIKKPWILNGGTSTSNQGNAGA